MSEKRSETSGCTLLALTFLLVFISPAQGLKCYECTNDDAGCFAGRAANTVSELQTDIPSKYEKDCGGSAIGCVVLEVNYRDFIIGDFYYRACFYKEEKKCFELDGDPMPVSASRNTGYFNEVVSCWKESRAEKGRPLPVLTKRNLPQIPLKRFRRTRSLEELGNAWYPIELPGQKEPQPKDISCYSCESEIPEYGFFLWRNLGGTIKRYPPACAEGETPKTTVCKGAYGCLAFWEVREENTKRVSRVWRGCWYPGEMRCLWSVAGGAGRALKERSSKDGDKEECKKAYQRTIGRQGGDREIYWMGYKEIGSLEGYGAYLKCVREIRAEKGVDFTSSIKTLEDIHDPDKDIVPFANWLYYFCTSNEGNCNVGKVAKKPPDGWTPDVKVKSTPTPQPILTTTSPPTGEGEPWEHCKEEEGEKPKGSGFWLRYDAYLNSLLIYFLIFHV